MQTLLRRHMLALMLGVTALSYTASPFILDSAALARGGSDDGGGDDSGGDGDSSGDGDDSGDDSDSDGDSSDDGDDSGDDDSDDSDDDNDDDDDDDDSDMSSGNKAGRPTATITLSADSLAKVRAGTHVVVDQLGRQLEIRVSSVNGAQVITAKPHGGAAKRSPGPITTIDVVPASTPGIDN